MANRYAVGDWRNAAAHVPPDVQQFAGWVQSSPQIQQILRNPQYAGNSPAQRQMRQAVIHQVVVQNGQHIPQGLKINADGQLETDDQTGMPGWAKALLIGGGAAGAVFGLPALASVFAGGGGAAGAGAAEAAGAGLGPATAASMADTAAIVGGSAVPASLSAAGIPAAVGAGAGVGAGVGTAAALGPATPESLAATQAVMGGATVPASLSSAGVPLGGGGAGLGGWLSAHPSVLPTAIGVGGQLGAAAIQSSGLSKAAEIEAAVQREALAYEKQRDQYLSTLEQGRYADVNTRLAPYLGLGQSAAERLGGILGLSTAGPTLSTPPLVPGMQPVPTGVRPGLTTNQLPGGTAVPRY